MNPLKCDFVLDTQHLTLNWILSLIITKHHIKFRHYDIWLVSIITYDSKYIILCNDALTTNHVIMKTLLILITHEANPVSYHHKTVNFLQNTQNNESKVWHKCNPCCCRHVPAVLLMQMTNVFDKKQFHKCELTERIKIHILKNMGRYRQNQGHNSVKEPGPRLNIKTVLSTYGDFHVKDKTAVRTSYL